MTASTPLPQPYTGSLAAPPPPGVKLACAACIRGHRTSSCNHKDGSKGLLYLIRSKGRPPTQCDFCRQKRKESGRHTRCNCKQPSNPTTAAAAETLSHSPPRAQKRKAVEDQPDEHARSTGWRSLHEFRQDFSSSSAEDGYRTPPQGLPPLSRTSSLDSSAVGWPTIPSMVMADLHGEWSAQLPNHAELPFRPLEMPSRSPRSSNSLSLSNLMNPCRCSTSGHCTCCGGSSQGRRRSSDPEAGDMPPLDDDRKGRPACCTESECCAFDGPSPDTCPKTQKDAGGGGCCSSGATKNPAASASSASRAFSPVSPRTPGCRPASLSSSSSRSPNAPSIELLLRAVDMTSDFVPPKCGCGDTCQCPSCLGKDHEQQQPQAGDGDGTRTVSDPFSAASTLSSTAARDGTTDCNSCMACDLSLSKPSGIGAIDQWIEQEKRRQHSQPDDSSCNPTPSANLLSVAPLPVNTETSLPGDGTTLHGGLLSSAGKEKDEIRAELVLVHPGCTSCLEVVRSKGVGILSASVPGSR